MKNSHPTLFARTHAVVLLAGLMAVGITYAAPPDVPDKFTATTTSMTPSGVSLRVDVRAWSDEAARGAVVAALAQESGVRESLASLPTVGYVWQSGSGVGYSVKYAHRASTPQGERVTFVTDRPIGGYEFKPWSVKSESSAPTRKLDYTVIELYLDGNGRGDGTLSLAADVKLDTAGASVSLEPGAGAAHVLADAKLEPKPYWATGK